MGRIGISILIAVSLGVLLPGTPDVWAGCGCDHPTPCPAPVMPGFASPGDRIKLTGEGFSTETEGNLVIFGSNWKKMGVEVAAKTPETLFVHTPNRSYGRYSIGPMPIRVKQGDSTVAEYGEDQFTYLNSPLVLEQGQGHYVFYDFTLAVDSFGVLYIPLDVSQILDATNFMVFIDNLPLEFTTDNVLIYNKDGFDLNLFTLDVEGIEKQWGDWYGVQGMDNQDPNGSDVLTYWRHEFYTYAAAHAPGGKYYAHTENEEGYVVHEDGTVHVDHDRLVVAVNGQLRASDHGKEAGSMTPLEPGMVVGVNIHVLQLQTEDPDVWNHLSAEQMKILAANQKVTTPYTSGFVMYNVWDRNGYDFSFPWEKFHREHRHSQNKHAADWSAWW